jgi:hypothetical protein
VHDIRTSAQVRALIRRVCVPCSFSNPPRSFPRSCRAAKHLDPVVSRLLACGLSLLGDAGQMPPPARGWHLRLALGRATLRAPDNTVVYRGTCRLPSSWRAVAAQAGGPVVIIGAIGLHVASDTELTPERLRALIHAAAGMGSLVAAQITRQPLAANPRHRSLPCLGVTESADRRAEGTSRIGTGGSSYRRAAASGGGRPLPVADSVCPAATSKPDP